MSILRNTVGVCFNCRKPIPASYVQRGQTVVMRKECEKCGVTEDIVSTDADMFKSFQKYRVEEPPREGSQTDEPENCPFNCWSCSKHKCQPMIAIIDVTYRCNLVCPVCFAASGDVSQRSDPALDEIVQIIKKLRQIEPIPPRVLQLSGGEPTLRKDLPTIISEAKNAGFERVFLNTNGLKLGQNPQYCQDFYNAGLTDIYLQFDGVDAETTLKLRGKDIFQWKTKVLENIRDANLGRKIIVHLVPTIVGGLNVDQVGPLIDYSLANSDVVASISYQPISLCGRFSGSAEARVTAADVVNALKQHTDGKISPVLPVCAYDAFFELKALLSYEHRVSLVTDPQCGVFSWLVLDQDRKDYKSISHYFDIERFRDIVVKASSLIKEREGSRWAETLAARDNLFLVAGRVNALNRLYDVGFRQFIKYTVMMKVYPLVSRGDGEIARSIASSLLSPTLEKSWLKNPRFLKVNCEHFLDANNFDLARVQRCVVQYAMLRNDDLYLIPFCSMNTFHRPAMLDRDEGNSAVGFEE